MGSADVSYERLFQVYIGASGLGSERRADLPIDAAALQKVA